MPVAATATVPGLHASWLEEVLFVWGDGADDPSIGGKPVRYALLFPDGDRETDGRELDPAHALDWLTSMSDSGFSADIRFWSRAAKLALELLARQRFAPALVGDRACWRPVLDDPRDAERVRRLVDAMPDACRAGASDLSRRTLLVDFLRAVMDAAIRRLPAPDAVPDDSIDRWLNALTSPDARVKASDAQHRVLRDEIDSWTAPLGASDDAPFRTCFRLDEPERDRGRWNLGFEMQAADDPSLRLPAKSVWKGDRYLERRFHGAGERFLADLGRAGRLFGPIDSALREPAPDGCLLTTDDAYSFLREASSLLEESGFGIFVPGWWKSGIRLTLQASLSPKGGRSAAARGLFGLDSIVQFEWQAALGDEVLPIAEFEKLAKMKVPLVRVRGQWVELRRDDIERALEAIRSGGAGLSLGDALRLAASKEAGLPVSKVEANGWVADLLDATFEEIAVPTAMRAELRPYQKRGLAWLAFMRRLGLGACLADDMGLGKTVQLIASLLAAPRRGPALVVCPTSVMANWEQEIARFGPSLTTLTHHGTDRRGRFAGADVVLTSYGTAMRDQAALEKVSWDTVVLDEAQNIKNAETKQGRAVRSLRASFRVALTGTPVENRLSDLWSIFEFLNPGYLGPAQTFRKTWALPIERWQDARRAEALRRLIGPFILRRVKTDPAVIQDLPDKIETKEFWSGSTRPKASNAAAKSSPRWRSSSRSATIRRTS